MSDSLEDANRIANETIRLLLTLRDDEILHRLNLVIRFNETTADLSRWKLFKSILFYITNYSGFVKHHKELLRKSLERQKYIERQLQKYLAADPY